MRGLCTRPPPSPLMDLHHPPMTFSEIDFANPPILSAYAPRPPPRPPPPTSPLRPATPAGRHFYYSRGSGLVK
ncbi:hypothetical protein EVAR_11013_1 [Eumeta japonica]|uniref:Uncharacterized protein n=1 Tax=Eumeta variegata TaxID=151549 RepID=A0A4C1YHR2_EUMVA|nr:hypothetical protein EVAR_11013_1 [Eumeta japonica]